MTFFEQELRKIVGDICPSATFVGRMCYIELTEQNRAKVFFNDRWCVNNFNGLQVTILNKNQGEIDSLFLRFQDIWGIKSVDNPNFPNGLSPYAWTYKDETEWYVYKPSSADYKKLQNCLLDYLKVFDYRKDRKLSLDARIAEAEANNNKVSGVGHHINPELQNGR